MMKETKQKTRIIQISGLRGMLLIAFAAVCLAAGFVGFPGYVAMYLWNRFGAGVLPAINLYQGVLLWLIFAMVVYITTFRQKCIVAVKTHADMTDEEIRQMIENIKLNRNRS